MASSKDPKSTCPRSVPISRDSSPAVSSLASIRALISANSSTAWPKVPTSSSSGTSSRESLGFSSSATFSSRPPRSSCCFPRSSIGSGLYTIPTPSSAPRRPALVPTMTAQQEGERRIHQRASRERHNTAVKARSLPSLRHPVYGFYQVIYHLFGGAIPFGPLLDEVLQEDRVYSPDGREDSVGLLDDVGVGYVALLDHLLDSPDMAFHALEPAYHLAPGLPLQRLRYLPLSSDLRQ